jgi:hypothetical protein
MQLACPKCGTREARISHRRTLWEQLKGIVGIYPLRCRRCRNRWETSSWAGGAWKYARCPRCYRQELTTWSEQYYRPPTWTNFLLSLGATRYRCAACRCNFASFKPCKERFKWRQETRVEPAADAGPVAASQPDSREPLL